MADAIGLNCGIWKVREDKIPRSSLVVTAWRAQVLWGRLGFEGLLLFMYSNFILWWIDFDFEGRKEVFR